MKQFNSFIQNVLPVKLLTLIACCMLLLCANFNNIFAQTVIYDNNGSATIPCGATNVNAELWGAGGGGGGSISKGGGGGGGAGAHITVPVAHSATAGYSVVVGKGGAGGTGNTSINGTVGGSSQFGSATAAGGGGGGGNGSNHTGGTGGTGGTPNGGSGQNGSANIGGAGGNCPGGGSGGAATPSGSQQNGEPGNALGGGGGGALANNNGQGQTYNGGAGADGRVIVTFNVETLQTPAINVPTSVANGASFQVEVTNPGSVYSCYVSDGEFYWYCNGKLMGTGASKTFFCANKKDHEGEWKVVFKTNDFAFSGYTSFTGVPANYTFNGSVLKGEIESGPATLTITASPDLRIDGKDKVCPDDDVIFTAESDDMNFSFDDYKYEWGIDGDGSAVGSTNDATFTVKAKSDICTGNFTVTLELEHKSGGCKETAPDKVVTVEVGKPLLKNNADPPVYTDKLKGCRDDAADLASEAFGSIDVASKYKAACPIRNISGVTHGTPGTPSGGDCSWTIKYTYDVEDDCTPPNVLTGESITFSGGTEGKPSLKTGPPVQIDPIKVCKDDAEAAVEAAASSLNIAGFYEAACSGHSVSVTKGSAAGTVTGSDCSWEVTYTYDVEDDCTPPNRLEDQRITFFGGNENVPTLTGTEPSGTTNINACYIDATTKPAGAPDFDAVAVAAQYSDACGNPVTAILTNTAVTGDFCGWTLTYTYKVVDGCDNELTGLTIVYTGKDKTLPALKVAGVGPVGTSNNDGCYINATTKPAGAPDFDAVAVANFYKAPCSNNTVTAILTNTAVTGDNCAWTLTYTYKVSDGCTPPNELTGLSIQHTGGTSSTPAISTTAENNYDFGCLTEAPTPPTFTVTDACAGLTNEPLEPETDGPVNNNCAYTQTWTASYTNGCLVAETKSITYTWTLNPTPEIIVAPGFKPSGIYNCQPVVPEFIVIGACDTDPEATVVSEPLLPPDLLPGHSGIKYTASYRSSPTCTPSRAWNDLCVIYQWVRLDDVYVCKNVAVSGYPVLNANDMFLTCNGQTETESSIATNPNNIPIPHGHSWDFPGGSILAHAKINSGTNHTSNILQATFPALNIPAGATILSVKVVINKYAAVDGKISDFSLELLSNATTPSTPISPPIPTDTWTGGTSVYTYVFPTSWNYLDFNSAITVRFQAQNLLDNNPDVYINSMRIEVVYTLSGVLRWFDDKPVVSTTPVLQTGSFFAPFTLDADFWGNPNATTLPNVGSKTYYVVCTTDANCYVPVTLTVLDIPEIADTDTELCSNTSFTFNPADEGHVPSHTRYTWSAPVVSGISGASSGSNAHQFTSGTLVSTNAVPTPITFTVTPTTHNRHLDCTGDPFDVTITVNPKPVIESPATKTICSGDDVAYTPTSNTAAANTTYSWTRAAVPEINLGNAGVGGSNVTTITETLTNSTADPVNVVYKIIPKWTKPGVPIGDPPIFCDGDEFELTVTVNPRPRIANHTSTVCSGKTVPEFIPVNDVTGPALSLDIVPANTTYTWTVPVVASGLTGFGTAGSGTSFNSTDIFTNTTAGNLTVVYTVTATSPTTPSCASTFTVTVTVFPKITVAIQTNGAPVPVPFTVCPNALTEFSIPTGGTYTNIVWTVISPTLVPTASILGPNNRNTVEVKAGSNCGAIYVLTLTAKDGNSCDVTASVTVKIDLTSATYPSFSYLPVPTALIGIFDDEEGIVDLGCNPPVAAFADWTDDDIKALIVLGNVCYPSDDFTLSEPVDGRVACNRTLTYTASYKNNCMTSPITKDITIKWVEDIPSIFVAGDLPGTYVCEPYPDFKVYDPCLPEGNDIVNPTTVTFTTTIANNKLTRVYTVTYTTAGTFCASGLPRTVQNTYTYEWIVLDDAETCYDPASTVELDATILGCSGGETSQFTTTTTIKSVVNDGDVPWITTEPGNLVCVRKIKHGNPLSGLLTVTCSGITIPAGATIKTVSVIINKCEEGNPPPNINDLELTLSSSSGATIDYATIPGQLGMWPVTTPTQVPYVYTNPATPVWTPADINGQTFDISYRVEHSQVPGGNNSAKAGIIYGISVRVTYTNATGEVYWFESNTGTADITTVPPVYLHKGPTFQPFIHAPGSPFMSSLPSEEPKTHTYFAVCSNDLTCFLPVQLTVNPTPIIGPKSRTVCSEQEFLMNTLTRAGLDITDIIPPTYTTFTWAVPAIANPNLVAPTPGLTKSPIFTQTLKNTTNTPQSTTYTVLAKWENNLLTPTKSCSSSFTFTVTVNPRPYITDITETTCSGTPFIASPSNDPPANIVPNITLYSWAVASSNNVSGASGKTDPLSLPFATTISQTLTLNNPLLPGTATYTVTPHYAECDPPGTCAIICSGSTFTLTVIVKPKPIIQNKTRTICSGESFTLPLPSMIDMIPTGTTYSWGAPTGFAAGNVTGAGIMPQTLMTSVSIGQLINNTNENQTVIFTITPKTDDCEGTPFTLTVTLKPDAKIANKTYTMCSGEDIILPIILPGDIVPSGTLYSWAAPAVLPAGGVTGTAMAAQTGVSSFTGTLINNTPVVKTVTYTIYPTSGTCDGASFTVTVTLNPRPKVNNKSLTICGDDSFNLPLPSVIDIVPTGTVYSWPAPVITPGGAGAVAGYVDPQTDVLTIGGQLINTTNIAQTVTYTITPKFLTCVGDDFTLTVTVNPRPKIDDMDPLTICSGDIFTLPAFKSTDIIPTGTTYTWTSAIAAPGATGDVTGVKPTPATPTTNLNNIVSALTNHTDVPQTVVYTVTTAAGTCVNSFTIAVIVNPRPDIANHHPFYVCSDSTYFFDPATIVGNLVPAGTTYSWTTTNVDIANMDITVLGPSSGSKVEIRIANETPGHTQQGYVRYDVIANGPAAWLSCESTFKMWVTVYPWFTPGAIDGGNFSICSGEEIDIHSNAPALGGNGSISYRWFKKVGTDPEEEITPEFEGNGSGPSYYIPLTDRTNSGTTPIVITYRREAKDGLCVNWQNSLHQFVLTVHPEADAGAISGGTQTICANGTPNTITNLASATGETPIAYRWLRDGIVITGTVGVVDQSTYTPGTGSSDILVPNNTYRYTREAKANQCMEWKLSDNFWTLTIHPAFTAGEIASTGQMSVCTGVTPIITIGNVAAASGGYGTIEYQWERTYTGSETVPSPITINSNTSSYTPGDMDNISATGTYTYIRKAKNGTCQTDFTPSAGSWVLQVSAIPRLELVDDEFPERILCDTDHDFSLRTHPGCQEGKWVGARITLSNPAVANFITVYYFNDVAPCTMMEQNYPPYCGELTFNASGVAELNAGGFPFSSAGRTYFRILNKGTATTEMSFTTLVQIYDIASTGTVYTSMTLPLTKVLPLPSLTVNNLPASVGCGDEDEFSVVTNTGCLDYETPLKVGARISLDDPSVSEFITVYFRNNPYTFDPPYTPGYHGILTFDAAGVAQLNPGPFDFEDGNETYFKIITNGNAPDGTFITAQVDIYEYGTSNILVSEILEDIPLIPKPVITSPLTDVICSGQTFSVPVPTNVLAGTTYTWTSAVAPTAGSVNGIAIGTTPQAFSALMTKLTNTTNVTQTVTYSVSALKGACVSTFEVVVTVNPMPAINPKAITICNDTTFTVSASDLSGIIPTGTNFDWTVSNNPSSLVGATSGSGPDITGTLTNPHPNISVVTYRVTATAGACSSTFALVVNVRPQFRPGSIENGGAAVCHGSTVPRHIHDDVSATGGGGAITYYWVMSVDGGAPQTINSNTALYNIPDADKLNPLPATTDKVITYTRYAYDGVCVSPTLSAGTFTLTVHAEFDPGTITSGTQTICASGTPSTITGTVATGGKPNPIYQWFRNGELLQGTGTSGKDYLPGTATNDNLVYGQTYVYSREAMDNNGDPLSCVSWKPSGTVTYTLTIYDEFTAGAISSNFDTICVAGTPKKITSIAPATGGNLPVEYNWFRDGVRIHGPVAIAHGAEYQPGTAPNDKIGIDLLPGNTYVYTREARDKDGTCQTWTLSLGSWSLTIYPEFDAGAITGGSETVCSGSTTPVITIFSTTAATGGNGVISYQWYKDGDEITGATGATYTIPASDRINNTTTIVTHEYTRWVNDTKCEPGTFSVGKYILHVRPAFRPGAINNVGETVCVGTMPSAEIKGTMPASGGDEDVIYRWKIDGALIPGASGEDFMPTNYGVLAGIADVAGEHIIIREAKDGTCSGWIPSINTWKIIVTNSSSIALTSAPATAAQTVRAGNNIAPITYKTTGATGATVAGLPADLTYGWANNVLVISGTATTVGTYTYAVTLIGGCNSTPVTGTITVKPACPKDTLDVANGTTYTVVEKAGFCWYRENLHNLKYQDGTLIAPAPKPYKHTLYPNEIDNEDNFGLLYSYDAIFPAAKRGPGGVGNGTICVDGWRLPTAAEWDLLNMYSMSDLKEQDYWLKPNSYNTDDLGFRMRGAGYYCSASKRFEGLYGVTYFWAADTSNDPQNAPNVYGAVVRYNCSNLEILPVNKPDGLSIRCLMDEDQ